MRSIRVKFLVAVSLFVVAFCGFVFLRSQHVTRKHAEQLTASRAELALQFDMAIRSYVGKTIRPLMEKLVPKGEFIPEAMSTSYVARSVFDGVKKELPDLIIKFSSDNPRNPVNSAGPEEMKLLRFFRENPGKSQWTGSLQMNGKPYFVQCIPRRLETSCLHCHGRPEDAPASLMARYGAKAGFHQKVGDIVALDTVGIPMDKVDANIASESKTQLAVMGVGVAVLIGALVFFFRFFIGDRLAKITAHFQKETAKSDEMRITPVHIRRHDEIGVLATSFNSLATRLDALHDSLEQRVEERTALLQEEIINRKQMEGMLRDAKNRAEMANRIKSEFLANMSHEIRTPMTAILGFTDIMMSQAATEEASEVCEIIKRNGEHLLKVINDILDLSKIESGKIKLDLEPCSLQAILADVLGTLQAHAYKKGLTLTVDEADDVPAEIVTDPVRLRQILVNLIGNAIKFTEHGSVRVAVHRENQAVRCSTIGIDIIDTGIGITDEHLAKLFQPFSQVDSSAQRRFGGTGLGLAISKRLAKMLGGDIRVTSAKGKGTIFHLTVAMHAPDKATAPKTPSEVQRRPTEHENDHRKLDSRILLAEDGADNQRLITYLLQKAGAKVTVVENGQKAVELAIGEDISMPVYDLILMDMQMPVMDGYEATRKLRDLGYQGPIIALTAHAMKEDRQRTLDAGCDDYLSKPIDHKALLRLIARYAVRRRSEEPQPPAIPQEGINIPLV